MRQLLYAARILGAALLTTTAGIHLHLWDQGYRDIHVIGPLFLANAIAGFGLAFAVLAVRGRLLPLVAVVGAGLELSTLGGLIITVEHGLFGFQDSSRANLFWQSVWVEVAGAIVLTALASATTSRLLVGRRRLPKVQPAH